MFTKKKFKKVKKSKFMDLWLKPIFFSVIFFLYRKMRYGMAQQKTPAHLQRFHDVVYKVINRKGANWGFQKHIILWILFIYVEFLKMDNAYKMLHVEILKELNKK